MTGLFCLPWSGTIGFLGSSKQWTESKCAGSYPHSRQPIHLGGRTWRRPTPLPSTNLGHFIHPQAALAHPTLWLHGPCYRQGIRCIHHAETYQLRQFMAPAFFVFLCSLHPFELCYLRHFTFCPMQPSASLVDLCAWSYVLGSQNCV